LGSDPGQLELTFPFNPDEEGSDVCLVKKTKKEKNSQGGATNQNVYNKSHKEISGSRKRKTCKTGDGQELDRGGKEFSFTNQNGGEATCDLKKGKGKEKTFEEGTGPNSIIQSTGVGIPQLILKFVVRKEDKER